MRIVIPGELPDLNTIVAQSKKHWGSYSSLKKTNTQAVVWAVKQARIPKLRRISLTCHWYMKDRRKDKDNIAAGIKFILDGLVEAGVIPNDNWRYVADFSHVFHVDKDNPRVEVEIKEVSQ